MLPLRERSRSGNGRLVQRIPVFCLLSGDPRWSPSEPNCRAFHVKSSINLQLHRRPGICQRLARESLPRVEPDVTPMTRILAIEPNPERAQALRQLVHDRLGADLVLADSTAAAIAAMTKQAADLILTSILLPPNDDSQLTELPARVRSGRQGSSASDSTCDRRPSNADAKNLVVPPGPQPKGLASVAAIRSRSRRRTHPGRRCANPIDGRG